MGLLHYEHEYWAKGHTYIAGIDEVGMGCLAGPVIAGAVILNPKSIPEGINDSKLLSPKKRSIIDHEIRKTALAYAIGEASVEEIDRINIHNAGKLAMRRAVEKLSITPTILLIDGRAKIPVSIQQIAIIKGDTLSASIGAGSIIAKVYRDNLMTQLDNMYPGYDFASHKGYGSVAHRTVLTVSGISPIHRKSFHWSSV